MAKAIQAFTGNDSYGRPVDVAIREDGVHFFRSYGYNGYAAAWSKWAELDKPSIPNEFDQYEWGFRFLRKGNEKGLRLPNLVQGV